MKNAIAVAYLGDAVYELFIREYLINTGISKVSDLYKASLKYVSASSQTKHLEHLLAKNSLSEEELEIIKRGRNAKSNKPKNTDVLTYRKATGLECLIGQLYLDKKYERINDIMNLIVGD